MRKFVVAYWALFCLLFSLAPSLSAQTPTRTKYNFNPGWLVFVGDPAGADQPTFDDHAWKHITTPYAWNEDSAFRVSIHDLPTGVAWYRKHFRLPDSATNKKIFLEFEGIRQAGDVYLNGRLIGRHEDGVMAFGFDISTAVLPTPQENVLAVRTDNRWDYKEKATGTTYHWNNNNFYANFGGISKSVWLHVTSKVYQTLPLFSGLGTTGTYIWASDFNIPEHSAKITAESQVRNDDATPKTITYSMQVVDMDHKVIGHMSSISPITLQPNDTQILHAEAVLNNLQFWSWGYGYLYDVVTTLTVAGHPVDTVTTRTGFRKTTFANGMVTLNDRVIQMHGYGQRTTNEWPAVGLSVPPWMSDLSNRMMVESNGNLVRWMHVVPWKQDVESSDRVGLIESMPAGDAEGDSKGRQWEQRVELMRDAIIYNRNNPSILFYESGNKTISDEHMLDMKRVRDQYDPHGGRAIGAREMLASTVAEYGGEMLYINKSATKPLWAHEYSRDEGARKFWDDNTTPLHKDSPLYNRNQNSHAIEDVERWFDYWHERPGTGTRVSSGGVNIIFSDSNTHYRGDNNYRRSGEVDAMRIPKNGYFAHQVMWNGWVDVEHPGTHILGHWNYTPGTVKPIYVVSTADKVELKLNGRSLGYGTQSSHFLFTFNKITFAPGTLEAIGYDAHNQVITHAELKTAGAPTAIRLTPHTGPGGLRADGADMALIDVEVVDANGNRCPTALNAIQFNLTGAAEWRGGIAQGSAIPVAANIAANDANSHTANPTPLLHEDNYILSKLLPVEGGINRIILRSTPTAGAITLTATANGLKPATLKLTSRLQPVTAGLSTEMPATGLTSYLKRGPTPTTPSFQITRTALIIASATAGSNESGTAASYDDNETTGWSSDGELPNAWIEYTLATPDTINELELKLNGFRQHRFPLRITVDGATVWEGLTPTTLGYCTLPLKPTKGQRLRITLTAPPQDEAQLPGTQEITGKVEVSGIAPVSKNKPILNIIETEIYKNIQPTQSKP
jgi:beta-galactosidase